VAFSKQPNVVDCRGLTGSDEGIIGTHDLTRAEGEREAFASLTAIVRLIIPFFFFTT
jgi:hypothetical protein